MEHTIAVKHNIEVAHRLFELPGKCENIHGHSMWVTMELTGRLNDHGILGGIEYGDLKKEFRSYLDEEYDHRLLLNREDPWSRPVWQMGQEDSQPQIFLPGLNVMEGDPTTENLSKWITSHFIEVLKGRDIGKIDVTVWETSVNMARSTIHVPYGER